MTTEVVEKVDKPKTPLRGLHDTQVSLEKFRIQLSNRISALARGVDEVENPVPQEYLKVMHLAEQMEAEIDKGIGKELKRWPVYLGLHLLGEVHDLQVFLRYGILNLIHATGQG